MLQRFLSQYLLGLPCWRQERCAPKAEFILLGVIGAFLADLAWAVRLPDDAAFTHLVVYGNFEQTCKAEKAKNISECVREAIGVNFSKLPINAPDRYISDEHKVGIPNRPASPKQLAGVLNGYNLGLNFQVVECRVVAEIHEQQRNNIAKVASPSRADRQRLQKSMGYKKLEEELAGEPWLKNAMVPLELDLEEVGGKVWLSAVNLATLPSEVLGAPMRCPSHIKIALETGDLVKIAEARCSPSPSAQQPQTEREQAGEKEGRQAALNNLKSRLGKFLGGREKRDDNEKRSPEISQAEEIDPCLRAPAAKNAGGANDRQLAVATAAPQANPFDTLTPAPAQNQAAAPSRVIKDTLPGLITAPAGAVVADLRNQSDDPELSELSKIVAEIRTRQGFDMSMKKPQDRTAVYQGLADFLNRDRPVSRRAEIIGRATLMLKAPTTADTENKPNTVEFFTSDPPKPRYVWLNKELMGVLIGQEAPSSAKNAFAPSSPKPCAMDMLYKVHLVMFDRTTRKSIAIERTITYPELLGSSIAQKDASSKLVPAATGFGDVNSAMALQGYIFNRGDFEPYPIGGYKISYKNSALSIDRILFDMGETKYTVQSAK